MTLADSFRKLAAMAHERAAEYRAPYRANLRPDEEPAAFAQSGSYGVYSSLMELHMLLNKLADELDDSTEGT